MKTFREALQAEPLTITADLTLRSDTGPDDVARQVDLLGPHVDALQVSDNPWAWLQMSALSAAVLVQRNGLDAVPILACRDRNRIALSAELLGLRALGVTSVLLTRGAKIPASHPVKALPVFDTSGRELVELAAQAGATEPPAPGREFFIGIGGRAFRPSAGWTADSLKSRSAAGARFLQTQICYNLDILRQYMKRLVEEKLTWKFSVMVSLAPFPSAVTAKWVKDNLSDSRIPQAVFDRLTNASDQEAEGIALCAETMRAVAEIPGVSGINLMTMGNPEHLAAAIEASGLR